CDRLNAGIGPNGGARFVPVGLGAAPGLATLYMTKDPGGYSVYPSSADAVEHHPGIEGGRVEGTMVVEVTTLDEWAGREGVSRIDVIKLDTQGSELGILQGAARMLAGVRAVEVEVQFNELYEDVPLFGDVDRFLRRHGFVLWRLKNLSHYAQYGVPTGWRTPDVANFDEVRSVFSTGSGQLYWADAFFVKREVARPDPEAGWRQLVRDACVASALGFYDLVVLAVDAARKTGPSDELTRIHDALAVELNPTGALRAQTGTGEVLQGTLKFDMGQPHLEGWGWGVPQLHPSGSLRWTGPSRDAFVDLPVVVAPGTRLEVLVIAGMSDTILDNLAVELNGVAVPVTSSPHEHGLLYSGVVPPGYRSTRRFTRMVIRTVETVPWNVVHPDSDEDVELGVAVAWVRLVAPESR
ncbi:MAG: FkbM family methyltransferase, partial [Actinomycetota bacterium]|nr:FkbM family methyltransferase [Actinomycetota bacterium]